MTASADCGQLRLEVERPMKPKPANGDSTAVLSAEKTKPVSQPHPDAGALQTGAWYGTTKRTASSTVEKLT